MAITNNSVKCPDCGASLPIEEGRKQMFCTYCGSKIIITNENEYIYRHIDEAGIKQAETERIVKMRQLDLAEKKRIASEKTKKVKIISSLLLAAIGILLMVIGGLAGSASGDPDSGYYTMSMIGFLLLMGAGYIWLFSKNKDDDDDDFDGKIRIPESVVNCESKNYSAIEAVFRSAGFTNISCVPLNDLTLGLLKKPGMVESVTINGKNAVSGKKVMPNASVIISYHSFAGR